MADTSLQKPGDMPRGVTVPTKILESGLVSPTSLASDCFIQQQFSAKLQMYMIGYVNSIFSDYSVYS